MQVVLVSRRHEDTGTLDKKLFSEAIPMPQCRSVAVFQTLTDGQFFKIAYNSSESSGK